MIISTGTEAYNLVCRLEHRAEQVCGIDSETEGINPKVDPAAGPKGRIICWTLSFDAVDAFIWANAETWGILGPLLKSLPVVGHNIFGFDRHMFRKAGAPLGNIVGDTMRMFKLVNPSEEASASLKTLMKYWLQIEPVGSFMELFTRRKCLEVVPEGDIKRGWRKVNEQPASCACPVEPAEVVPGWVDEEGAAHPGYEEPEYTRHTRECKGQVPTLTGGAHSRVGSITETIPLSSLAADYPHLLPTLIKYAKLDARSTLELYRLFDAKLKEMQWEVPLLSSATQGSLPGSGQR